MSGHFVFHLTAAENMEMKVMYRLAGIGTAVGNNAIAAGQILLGGNHTDGAETFGQLPVGAERVQRDEDLAASLVAVFHRVEEFLVSIGISRDKIEAFRDYMILD